MTKSSLYSLLFKVQISLDYWSNCLESGSVPEYDCQHCFKSGSDPDYDPNNAFKSGSVPDYWSNTQFIVQWID